MTNPHTGDTAKVREWFEANPGEVFTAVYLSELLDITPRWKVGNAMSHLLRINVLTRGKKRGEFRLRLPDEAREEFKVAKVAKVVNRKPAIMPPPILVECDPAHVLPLTRQWAERVRGGIKDECIQYVSPTTFVVWNTPQQLRNMREHTLNGVH